MLVRPAHLLYALALGVTPVASCDDGGDDSGDTGESEGLTNPCENDTEGDEFAVGLSRSGASVTVEFIDAMPAPPRKGNNTWHLKVTDGTGAPIDGVVWEVLPWMPLHGHGTPVVASVEPMSGAAGEYMAESVNMSMAGLWEITLELTLPDDTTDSVMFKFCVDA